jgi:hypothetical protein
MELSIDQQFAVERFGRAIDNTDDVAELRSIAKELLKAWQMQRAATSWVIRQERGPWATMDPPTP